MSCVNAPPLEATAQIDARIRRLFPFELTAGQRQAIGEIAADMAQPLPMNRLLQGDVGSGKTVVALYAMLLAIAHRHQAVLMAPTEVLARQHALTVEKLLAASQVRRAAADRRHGGEAAGRPAGADRRRRDRLGGRHPGGHPGGRAFRPAGTGRDRRAAQVRRAPAGGAEARRARSALPGDDGHAHPADRRHDALRRPGRVHPAGKPAGPAAGAHLSGRRRTSARAGGSSSARNSARGGRATSSRRWSRNPTNSPPSASKRPTRRWPTASWRPSAWA